MLISGMGLEFSVKGFVEAWGCTESYLSVSLAWLRLFMRTCRLLGMPDSMKLALRTKLTGATAVDCVGLARATAASSTFDS